MEKKITAKKIIKGVGLATDPNYYKSRGVSLEFLSGERLANIYRRVKFWNGAEAARNFKEMLAVIRELSAYNVISALYMLEEKNWSYSFELPEEITDGREDYFSQKIREKFLLEIEPRRLLRERGLRRQLSENKREALIQEAIRILGSKLESSGLDAARIKEVQEKAEEEIKLSLKEMGFKILWSIKVTKDEKIEDSETKKGRKKKNLSDFLEEKEFERLGFYELDVDSRFGQISVSEVQGIRPSIVFSV